MAAAAYAALVSLLNTMDQFQIHHLLSSSFDKRQDEILRSNVDFFLEFVEHYHDADSRQVEDLMRRIAAAAHEAEDVIEEEGADLLLEGFAGNSITLLLNLRRRIEDMNSIKEDAIKVKEETGSFTNSKPPPPPSAPLATGKITTMVGFEGYVAQLSDELTGHYSGRRILPIVGMGGIGKTTLARNVYENSVMLHHFDVRAWVTVSQDYDAIDILSQAISCLGEFKSRNDTSGDEVGETLRKILYGRRYLVVLDDVWSVKAWEKIMFFFPENYNSSRIIVTTRQQVVVDYFASSALVVGFLDDKQSWELFCERTYPGGECCPPELEQAAKMIVKRCKGLPLAITVIGGLLGKSPSTPEYWEKIARDKSFILGDSGDEGNQVLSILYLSYKHLPVWLKPCFLYLGLLPEDREIDMSDLINFWIAEGFIKPNRNRSLEEVAESGMMDLIGRNLVIFGQITRLDKTVYVHDLVRELCIMIAEQEDFYRVQRDVDRTCHVIADETSARWFGTCERPSLLRPLLMGVHNGEAPLKPRLLRVLVGSLHCLDRSSHIVNLRFFMHPYKYPSHDLKPTCFISSAISLCWSLQTLVLKLVCEVVMPSEMWNMAQLRHILIFPVDLLDPPTGDVVVLHNLQTLKSVRNIKLKEVCMRIPNIIDLEIHHDFFDQGGWYSNMQSLGCFNKLEKLNYICCTGMKRDNQWPKLKLPSSLKHLSLSGCHIVWSEMAEIASLPNLQSLSLLGETVLEAEWDFGTVEFRCLKHLYISEYDNGVLVTWIAERSNFPILEELVLWNLCKLDQIPSGIGEIPTLREIRMQNCSESATISAVNILEEQECMGNQDLRLQLKFTYKSEEDTFRQQIQRLGYTLENLHLSSVV